MSWTQRPQTTWWRFLSFWQEANLESSLTFFFVVVGAEVYSLFPTAICTSAPFPVLLLETFNWRQSLLFHNEKELEGNCPLRGQSNETKLCWCVTNFMSLCWDQILYHYHYKVIGVSNAFWKIFAEQRKIEDILSHQRLTTFEKHSIFWYRLFSHFFFLPTYLKIKIIC